MVDHTPVHVIFSNHTLVTSITTYIYIYIYIFVGRYLATKVFIGKLPATGWV